MYEASTFKNNNNTRITVNRGEAKINASINASTRE